MYSIDDIYSFGKLLSENKDKKIKSLKKLITQELGISKQDIYPMMALLKIYSNVMKNSRLAEFNTCLFDNHGIASLLAKINTDKLYNKRDYTILKSVTESYYTVDKHEICVEFLKEVYNSGLDATTYDKYRANVGLSDYSYSSIEQRHIDLMCDLYESHLMNNFLPTQFVIKHMHLRNPIGYFINKESDALYLGGLVIFAALVVIVPVAFILQDVDNDSAQKETTAIEQQEPENVDTFKYANAKVSYKNFDGTVDLDKLEIVIRGDLTTEMVECVMFDHMHGDSHNLLSSMADVYDVKNETALVIVDRIVNSSSEGMTMTQERFDEMMRGEY